MTYWKYRLALRSVAVVCTAGAFVLIRGGDESHGIGLLIAALLLLTASMDPSVRGPHRREHAQ